jgi:hypothetical protein
MPSSSMIRAGRRPGWRRLGHAAEKAAGGRSWGRLQVGFCRQIGGLVAQIPISGREDLVLTGHCILVALLNRSAHTFSGFRFFAENSAAPTEPTVNVWFLFGLRVLGVRKPG